MFEKFKKSKTNFMQILISILFILMLFLVKYNIITFPELVKCVAKIIKIYKGLV